MVDYKTDYNDFRLLRYKGPEAAADVDISVDDPDWFAAPEEGSPNSGHYIVAGTATAGDYVLTCTPVQKLGAQELSTAESVTFPRVAESNTAIATGMYNAVNTAVAALDPEDLSGIKRFIRVAFNPSAGVYTVVYRHDVPDFIVSLTAPAPGTMTHVFVGTSSGNRYPIARTIHFDRKALYGPNCNVEVTVVALDTSLQPLPPGSCTYSMEFLEGIPRTTEGTRVALIDAVTSRGTDALTPLGSVHTVQANGAHIFGARMHTIANIPAGTDRFEILYRPVVV